MSLETDIQANTAAILELTAAILGNKAAPAPAPPKKAAAAPPATKPAAAPPPPPTPTREAVTAACVAVNGARGQDTAKKAIKQFGKADMLKDVQPENFAALIAGCEAILAAPVDAEEAQDEPEL